ncbi:MAG: tetratricopeptide repeat protein [Hormoscilla sp. GM102CHS1]|nr:tetratricopeptide repeat protein [Hormoscilla sp. SP12CHS1]MBC6472487.1 tetratricopeptide repeat protein [Hormoscilla sp. GM102CHS1]
MSEKPIWHRVLAIVGGVSFIGSTVFAITSVFRDALTQPVSSETTEPTIEERLATQERGYEKVLQREPQNQVALEGLVSVRLQMKDARGAIAPLEKLVALYPDRTEYKQILAQVKQQKEQESEIVDRYSEGDMNR